MTPEQALEQLYLVTRQAQLPAEAHDKLNEFYKTVLDALKGITNHE